MALSKSNSANGNVTDIAKARRNRGQAQNDASSQSNAPPGDTSLSDGSDVAFADDVDPASAKPDKNGNRRFDREKVERIKAELAAGSYKIDPMRVADKFIEHERNS